MPERRTGTCGILWLVNNAGSDSSAAWPLGVGEMATAWIGSGPGTGVTGPCAASEVPVSRR